MPANAQAPTWTAITPLEPLAPGTLIAARHGRHKLVVGRREDGEVFALDNRCPHEGYPLAQGELKGETLTCSWHNWKFNTRSGACSLGGEAVRAFPTRERDGHLEVDLAEPAPEQLVPGLLQSFLVGLGRHENGRALRDGARLLQLGFEPERLLLQIALHDAQHAEYGPTHALPLAADANRFLEFLDGPRALIAIAPVLDLAGENNRRLPARERPIPVGGGDAESFCAAVENENAALAEGLLRGAHAEGRDRQTLEGWLLSACSRHFTDFGHSLIYVVKAGELMDRAGDDEADKIYGALAYALTLATREDTLPYFAPYTTRLDAILPELPALYGQSHSGSTFDAAALRDAILDGSSAEAFDSVYSALKAGVAAPRIARALVGAAAHRLLRFDARHDDDDTVAENWLWATHRFTFASAVRHAVERFDHPDALRFLFQAVGFIHSGHRMDAPKDARGLESVDRKPTEGAAVEDLVATIVQKDPARAAELAREYVGSRGVTDALVRALHDILLKDSLVRPIVVAHAIKTLFAALDEFEQMPGHPDRDIGIIATLRFLASPIRERRVRGAAEVALRWIVDGKMPRKLTQ